MLAVFRVGDCVASLAGLRLPLLGLAVACERVRPSQRFVCVGEVPVADPVRLAMLKAAACMPDRRLGSPENRVDA
jgi:hypothetical protein